MPAAINPQFQVVPFSYVSGALTETGYLLQMLYAGAPSGITPDPTIPALNYGSYAAMIAALGLQASKNYPQYPNAYVVGSGANNWATDAAAKAAAEADCNALVAQRNSTLAATGLNANNPFVTLSAAVLGPL